MGINDLRCYVCGKPVGKHFVLLSMSKDVDRVFIVGEDCLARVEDDAKTAVSVGRND